MNNKEKFEKFLESLKGKAQNTLIESVEQGFKVCFEYGDTPPMQYDYAEVVFLQGEDANEVIHILNKQGEDAAMNYLAQWDHGDNYGESRDTNPAGDRDTVYARGDHVMSYNTALGYAGLVRRFPTN